MTDDNRILTVDALMARVEETAAAHGDTLRCDNSDDPTQTLWYARLREAYEALVPFAQGCDNPYLNYGQHGERCGNCIRCLTAALLRGEKEEG